MAHWVNKLLPGPSWHFPARSPSWTLPNSPLPPPPLIPLPPQPASRTPARLTLERHTFWLTCCSFACGFACGCVFVAAAPPSCSSCSSLLTWKSRPLPPPSSLLTNKSRLLTCEGRPLTCKVRAGRSYPSCSSLLPPAPPSSLPPAAPSPLLPLPAPPSALTCKSRPLHVRTNP